MIDSYNLLEFSVLLLISWYVSLHPFSFCNCHCFACVQFFVTACMLVCVCYFTVSWGLFLWVGILPGAVAFSDHTKYSFQSETVYKVRESMVP